MNHKKKVRWAEIKGESERNRNERFVNFLSRSPTTSTLILSLKVRKEYKEREGNGKQASLKTKFQCRNIVPDDHGAYSGPRSATPTLDSLVKQIRNGTE